MKISRLKYELETLLLFIIIGFLFFHVGVMPRKLFEDTTSTVLLDDRGNLLGARIAGDDQWRFPESDTLNQRFVTCLVNYEDRRFYYHIGVDPIAVVRAFKRNVQSSCVKEGGSTLTMQLARMIRGNQPRTLKNKLIEVLYALDIELSYSKEQILRMYVSHAPFGGNVVGVNAAAWRYYNRDISCLSWSEVATLAVLPNSPSLIHPGRNRTILKKKRDQLLTILQARKIITADEYELAIDEPLPDKPYPLPNEAPHLLDYLSKTKSQTYLHTHIDARLQHLVQQLANEYSSRYSNSNNVDNIAILVMDVETGQPIAYVGNTTRVGAEASYVDIIQCERSPGSTLKPFLYAAMISCGELTPRQLISDTPLSINGFTPSNFNHTFSGAVHADDAIIQSLNVPLVRMLSTHGTGRFMKDLEWLGMTTLHFDEDHYGATLILGGAEVKLWDVCRMYRRLAYRLLHKTAESQDTRISLSASWFMFNTMSKLNRPEEESEWTQFRSMKNLAWKTGTSWGSRDAWSIGVTPKYVVGVWTGNATGEGRAGLTGIGYSAPIMFDVFAMLDNTNWFTPPSNELEPMTICKHSGRLASSVCADVETTLMSKEATKTQPCNYCRRVHLSADKKWQVNSSCMGVDEIYTESRFILPVAQEYYYKTKHADYLPLPPFMEGCQGSQSEPLDFIYPEHQNTIVLPRGFDGTTERVIFTAVSRKRDATIYWHLDNDYLGETQGTHQMSALPSFGSHTLSIVDDEGNRKMIIIHVK